MSNILFIERQEVLELIHGYDTERYKLVEEGDWLSNGKYAYKECIIQHIETGKYYRIYADRTGSYYSDYEYDYSNTATEVKQVEKVVTCWEVVSNE